MYLLAYSLAVDATNSGHAFVLKLMRTFTVLILMLMAMAPSETMLIMLCKLLIETRSSQKLNPGASCHGAKLPIPNPLGAPGEGSRHHENV